MKLLTQNTLSGLVPLYDHDYENKKRLTIGETYEVTIKKARNVQLHRKYFALFNCAWEYLNEEQQAFFKTIHQFRKTTEMAAGHCDAVYSIDRKEWIETPKSISFNSVDELEFRDLYDRVKDVIFAAFLKHITIEEFEKELVNF